MPVSERRFSGKKSPVKAIQERESSIASVLLEHLSELSLDQIPDLESLGNSLNLSASRLRHIIKEQTGVSFNRQVKTLRLRRARVLLRETCWSVKEVMTRVGLSDHSHFAKDYKKEFGESPTETRCKAIAAGKKITACQQADSPCSRAGNSSPQSRDGESTVAASAKAG